MLPSTTFTVTYNPLEFFTPDDLTPGLLYDYESGAGAINDGSLGLDYQPWFGYVDADGATVRLRPLFGFGNGTAIFSAAGITRMSFSFDRAMRPAIAYVQADGVVRFRRYDAVSAAYVTSVIASARTPRVTYDDKRASAAGVSDIILAYMKNDQLVYRQESDRFVAEHVVQSGLPRLTRLVNVGMAEGHRLQFQLALP